VTGLAPLIGSQAKGARGRIGSLVAAKAGRTIAVCIPARNEAATIGEIVRAITGRLVSAGLVDEVIVVDDGSTDATGAHAAHSRAVLDAVLTRALSTRPTPEWFSVDGRASTSS
jgi:glucosyl-3-phosphoglycerate synthase